MAGEINFIITVVILSVMAYFCQTRCSTETGYQSGTTKLLVTLGMGSMIVGMAIYYTAGMYALEIYAPFLIAGMILMVVGGCMSRRTPSYQTSKAPKHVQPTDLIRNDPETLNQVAEAARAKGLLIERKSSEYPLEVYRSLRCPTCRYLFDLGKARIVGFTVYCPSCDHAIEL